MNNEEPLFDPFEEDPFVDYELENDLLLMKLRAEFGGEPHFFPASEEDEELPAEVRYEILQNIYSLEQAFHDTSREMLTLDELLEHPYRVAEQYLTDEGVEMEFKRFTNLLRQHQFELETLYPTEIRILYRFITGELLSQRVPSRFAKGMFFHFVYEEFHPNHRKDIEKQSIDLIRKILNSTLSATFDLLNDEVVCGDEVMLQEEAVQRLLAFTVLFEQLEILDLQIIDIELQDELARVQFYLRYRGKVPAAGETELQGSGTLGFIRKYDIWLTDAIDIPGVVI